MGNCIAPKPSQPVGEPPQKPSSSGISTVDSSEKRQTPPLVTATATEDSDVKDSTQRSIPVSQNSDTTSITKTPSFHKDEKLTNHGTNSANNSRPSSGNYANGKVGGSHQELTPAPPSPSRYPLTSDQPPRLTTTNSMKDVEASNPPSNYIAATPSLKNIRPFDIPDMPPTQLSSQDSGMDDSRPVPVHPSPHSSAPSSRQASPSRSRLVPPPSTARPSEEIASTNTTTEERDKPSDKPNLRSISLDADGNPIVPEDVETPATNYEKGAGGEKIILFNKELLTPRRVSIILLFYANSF